MRTAAAKPRALVGVIGGSGLYDMPAVTGRREVRVRTPFGVPSGPILLGALSGVPCAFLPRHGRGHVLLPCEVNSRANIWALKSLGVERVVSISAVGSLKEELPPRDFVFPAQLVDETKGRVSTFFGGGLVAHVAFDQPFCAEEARLLHETARGLDISSHLGQTLVCMEGPAFSTKAESEYHRRQGYDIIGMTAVPEAKLAREAELCYAAACLVTDYDCWKEGEEVSSGKVVENLHVNVSNAQRLLAKAVPALAARRRACRCAAALAGAIFTDPRRADRRAVRRLGLLAGRYLKG
ncbi:MAG: S-methyl-5'-thioadenosine phosphorylase [Elusimicrobia bacterium]|nr:S-methyl-5'-thioadenosine phosphorylase [Elusimicrobiota bacterium]